VPTVGQWNQAFNNLQNILTSTPVSTAGQVMTGLLTTVGSISTTTGFNLHPGVNPLNPNPGDLWSTLTGLFVNIAGTTYQLAGGTSGFVGNIATLSGTQTWTGNEVFVGSVTFTGTVTALSQQNPTNPQGRLTIIPGSPVITPSMTGTTSSGTLYYSPYNGSMIPIYSGQNIVNWSFTASGSDAIGLSLTLGQSSVWGAGNIYDVFAVVNGSAGVDIATGPAWTNSTTRSQNLGYILGLLANNSGMAVQVSSSSSIIVQPYQGTYLGTIAIDANSNGSLSFIYGSSGVGGTALGGSAAFLNIWNYYNRVLVGTFIADGGSTYSYNSSSVRAEAGVQNMRISWISGLAEDSASTNYLSYWLGTTIANTGIGLDTSSSFTAFSSDIGNIIIQDKATSFTYYVVPPQIGYHFIQACEASPNNDTIAFNFQQPGVLPFNTLSFSFPM
jgi:hypothetical protein